jgi:hypothetical protein
MDFHEITSKFFVLDLPENLISTEARQDSDLILHEYESVIPEVIKNIGKINLSSCFLEEKSELMNLSERRNYNQPWNKRDPSWRKLSENDKKSDDFKIKKKFSPSNLKKVKSVEIKLCSSNDSPNDHQSSNLAVINMDHFSIKENKLNANIPKSQWEIGKLIGSILKTNPKEISKNQKDKNLGNLYVKYKIQDLYIINQIYKIENSLPVWFILCNYTNSSKSNIGISEFTMGPFSSECVVSFYKQCDITEETKLKIEKTIIKEEKTTNSKIFALLNNQQGIKIKNLLKALNLKDDTVKKRKKSFNNLSYNVDSAYYYDGSNNYSPFSTSPNEPSSTKSNQGKKINYNSGASCKKDSYDGNKKISRPKNVNYSDEYYYNQLIEK